MRQFRPLLLILPYLWSGLDGCEDGDVRLVDGFDSRSGRVEFCHEGEWGTVCDDNWKNEDAVVVCRQLGLPTSNVSFLSSFGGGNGSIILDNVVCRGDELRLEDCLHNGLGQHDCYEDHSEDAGVICAANETECAFDDTVSSGEPTLIHPVSRTCLQRYGHCIPFRQYTDESICDEFYTSEVDYVYIPNTRNRGRYSRLMRDIIIFAPVLLEGLDRCSGPARRILCHFYLPPCGNSTVFELPTSVCRETCTRVQEMCGEEWESVLNMFRQNRIALEIEGTSFIDCEDTGKQLSPLPYDCIPMEFLSIPTTKPGNGTNPALFAVIPAGATIIAVGIVAALVCVCRKNKKATQTIISHPTTHLERRSSLDHLDSMIPPAIGTNRYEIESEQLDTIRLPCPGVNLPRVPSAYLRQLTQEGMLIPRHIIHLTALVGQGEFGVVYKATLDGWQGNYMDTVAVKTLKVFSPIEQRRLIEESLVMIKFDHMNVMKLIGVSPHNRLSLYIVMPYMLHGSLLSYLRKNRANLTILNNNDLDLVNDVGKKLWSMCLQISHGMEYLASLQFVHRDLAARNCMIDDNYVIKVSDFGLTEDIYSRHYFRQGAAGEEDGEAPVKLPVRWMALESLNDGVFSEKSDVWSFGVTCWEVFSLGKTPYPGMEPHYIVRYLERGERLEKPANAACSEDMYGIVQECWNTEPNERPSFSELATDICESLEDIAGYLELTTPSLTLNSPPTTDHTVASTLRENYQV